MKMLYNNSQHWQLAKPKTPKPKEYLNLERWGIDFLFLKIIPCTEQREQSGSQKEEDHNQTGIIPRR